MNRLHSRWVATTNRLEHAKPITHQLQCNEALQTYLAVSRKLTTGSESRFFSFFFCRS
jgi:hypothetical protein